MPGAPEVRLAAHPRQANQRPVSRCSSSHDRSGPAPRQPEARPDGPPPDVTRRVRAVTRSWPTTVAGTSAAPLAWDVQRCLAVERLHPLGAPFGPSGGDPHDVSGAGWLAGVARQPGPRSRCRADPGVSARVEWAWQWQAPMTSVLESPGAGGLKIGAAVWS